MNEFLELDECTIIAGVPLNWRWMSSSCLLACPSIGDGRLPDACWRAPQLEMDEFLVLASQWVLDDFLMLDKFMIIAGVPLNWRWMTSWFLLACPSIGD